MVKKSLYGMRPVNSTAKRVLGDSRYKRRKKVKNEIKKLKKVLENSCSTDEIERAERRISYLTKKLESDGQPSDQVLTGKRAIARAEQAMAKAKWERDNSRK